MGENMDKSQEQFLQLLKSSLGERKVEFQDYEIINWDEIYNLAKIHKVIPMIYDTSCKIKSFKESDENLLNEWQFVANTTVFGEVNKRNRFVNLYRDLLRADMRPIVFKGIIISELYPSYDNRNYMNEDILIKKENFQLCHEILEMNGFDRKMAKEDREGVYNYFCPRTGLYLQVHTCLFGEECKNSGSLNEFYEDVYEDNECININGVDIYTFSIDKHLMYIIYNAIMDLKKNTIRIRCICDMTMFINTYHKEINWNLIWKEVINLDCEELIVNFLQIAIEYLGLDENKITYKKKKSYYNISRTNILEEILNGGIYGFDYEEKLNPIDIAEDLEEQDISILENIESIKDKYKNLINRLFTY